MRVLLIGLFFIAVTLYVLNPGPDKFREFLRDEVARYASEQARGAGQRAGGQVGADVAGFLAGRAGRRAGGAFSDAFSRENYHLFSTYEVDLNGRRPGGEFKFLGVGGHFFPLKRPEEL